MSLRWGILATGGIAETFAKDLVLDGHTIVAVGSRSQHSADAFAAAYDISHAHPSYEALVADAEVDIVYVATPHPLHVDNATLALAAGKHVLVEKPLTMDAAQARRLADLAAERGLLLLEAMWTRFLPHMVRIREIVAAGTLGQVRSLVVDHTQDLPDDPTHRVNALELGGGTLLDIGIYPISFAWDLFGEPSSVLATATFKPTGTDASVAVVLGFPGDRIASTFSANDTAGANTAVVLGTDARIQIDPVWYQATSFRVVGPDGAVLESYSNAVEGRGMQYQAREAERIIAAGRTASEVLPPEESVAIMATLDEVRAQIGLVYPTDPHT